MVKVERSMPAPLSLAREKEKANGSYNRSDVTTRLKKDFHGKCYICEYTVLDLEVEHRLPHKGGADRDRKFDWWNLFYCCKHCNSVKTAQKYDEGIIDCCRRDPEEVLSFFVTDRDVTVDVKDVSDQEAVLTAELTEEVFNMRNTGIRVVDAETRFEKLTEKMNILYTQLCILKSDPEDKVAQGAVREMLKRSEVFSGFTRSYVKSKDEFKWLMDDGTQA